MPLFERTIPVFERAKTFYALDRATSGIGGGSPYIPDTDSDIYSTQGLNCPDKSQHYIPPTIFLRNLSAEFNRALFNSNYRSRDRTVSIRTCYGLDGRGSIPSRSKIFLFSIVFRLALGPTQPPAQWERGDFSPDVKRPGREADHLPPSTAEVKNGEAITPLSHLSSWHNA
jgi:hypothetical protein